MTSLAAFDQILALSSLSIDFSSLIWIALILSVIAVYYSLIALRRAKRPESAELATAAAASAVSVTREPAPAFDPALIAVLSAAVTMMMDSSPRQSATDQRVAAPAVALDPAIASVAGFTIRKIRRV